MSGWDQNLLAEELTILFDDGYELEITGFTTADLNFALPEKEQEQADEVELPPTGAPVVSSLGDLWQSGPHRLYCGNAREAASWEALLGDERA